MAPQNPTRATLKHCIGARAATLSAAPRHRVAQHRRVAALRLSASLRGRCGQYRYCTRCTLLHPLRKPLRERRFEDASAARRRSAATSSLPHRQRQHIASRARVRSRTRWRTASSRSCTRRLKHWRRRVKWEASASTPRPAIGRGGRRPTACPRTSALVQLLRARGRRAVRAHALRGRGRQKVEERRKEKRKAPPPSSDESSSSSSAEDEDEAPPPPPKKTKKRKEAAARLADIDAAYESAQAAKAMPSTRRAASQL